MKPRLIASFVAFVIVGLASAEAGTVVSGTVTGIWDAAGSPYWVEGDLNVPDGGTLTIETGVAIRFRGGYELLVEGTLLAVGTVVDSILFTRDEPIPSHEWHGISLVGAEASTEIGYARIEHVRAPDPYPEVRGGAIWIDSCSPHVHHCLLQNNRSTNANRNGMGGGVACLSSSAIIEQCIIRNNYADSGGGICTLEYGTVVIRNNLIEGNTAPSSGGGIYAGVRSSPVIENNVVRNNTAYGWGGGGITLWNWYAAFGESKTVRSNRIIGNTTTAAGGGFYIRYDFSVLENNTVADNHATGGGGGIYVLNQGPGDYPPDVKNFIVWGNTGPDPSIKLEASTGSAVSVTYSDVEGGWSGTGNIDKDPVFADEQKHLSPESPCVDAGNPAGAFEDECFPPSEGGVRNDMGTYGGPIACGWLEDATAIEDAERGWPWCGIRVETRPNPLRSGTTLQLELPEPAVITARVYDSTGRLVRTIASERRLGTGAHRLSWEAMDDHGRAVAAGVYFIRCAAGGGAVVRRVSVIR
ncbi:MAG: T9SS type A sorting domain-containing protein [Candidatus Eisenbacteria bacterium]|nr:T9SS type A sorting domain-containing protein [Candidatus Latescibacterota bacterium]MBD3302131.1 T9SS type A sorting domain-containing protein [Candidatus Eisenbacteria bacterium]